VRFIAASTSSLVGSLVVELAGVVERTGTDVFAPAFLGGAAVWAVTAVNAASTKSRKLAMFLIFIGIIRFPIFER
jgi:hypothetical protein